MSNRLHTLSRKASAVLFLALTCSLGCGCLVGDGADDVDEPIVNDAAVDANEIEDEEIHLDSAIAALETQYQQRLGQQRGDQQKLDQQSSFVATDEEGEGEGDDDDGRSSNPEPTPWEPGAQDNPEPTPWIGSAGIDASNPEPTPWLDPDDDDDDDDLKTEAAFSANSTGGSGWNHGTD